MAWNQPGGNGGRDPWGDRGAQPGPPDLDEVLKKLQAGLGRLFRGGRGGGPPGGADSGVGGKGLLAILVVLLIGWGIWGFYVVEPPEQGVVLRFGKFVSLSDPGPHWLARPFYGVEKVNVEQVHKAEIGFRTAGSTSSSVPHESLMLTEDENIIDIKFAVLYRIGEPDKYLFNVLDPDNTLRQATESAVREIVGRSSLDVITERRNEVSVEAETLIQEVLDRYGEGGAGIKITSVNMQDAQPPKQVQEAFDDAVKAREDEERFKNEARAYAADILPKARGDANRIGEQATAYAKRIVAQAQGDTARFLKVLVQYQRAPEVTRERLYLETMESVMRNSSKVLLDVPGGSNLTYLPLDKLIAPPGRGAGGGGELRQFGDDQGRARGSSFGEELSRGRDALRGRSRE